MKIFLPVELFLDTTKIFLTGDGTLIVDPCLGRTGSGMFFDTTGTFLTGEETFVDTRLGGTGLGSGMIFTSETFFEVLERMFFDAVEMLIFLEGTGVLEEVLSGAIIFIAAAGMFFEASGRFFTAST